MAARPATRSPVGAVLVLGVLLGSALGGWVVYRSRFLWLDGAAS